MILDKHVKRRIQSWLDGPFDSETKKEIQRLLVEDPQALSDAFFQDLSFGTGGMRSLMGVGTNRINIYTIRAATQGLANYLKKQNIKELSAFLGYDTRQFSREFAIEAAKTFVGNGIKVFITESFCPTPLVSFACRYLKCHAAIMITASHNPPQYNGYKVYWADGGQIVPPHDARIIEEVKQVKEVTLGELNSKDIHWIQEEIDTAYLKELKALQIYPELQPHSLKIIYTSLHGTGIRLMPKALNSWGYENVALVGPQVFPDGLFPNAPSVNPEEEKALQMGTELLLKEKADLLIATDPDADRIGIVIRHAGKAFRFTGNQVACLCLYHICSSLKEKNKMPLHPVFIKTIVTTELFKKIALGFDCRCIDVLTGFKYIAEKIDSWEKNQEPFQFVFGAEESYGYLFGSFVRDKDAISTGCLIAEMASMARKKGQTLQDLLYWIYRKYGIYRESLTNIHFSEGQEGIKKMKALTEGLRHSPPSHIAKQKVILCEDYLSGKLPFPPSDVLRFWLQDGTKLVIRPSGTEPKIKIYAEVVQEKVDDLEKQIEECDKKLKRLLDSFKL